MITQLLKALFGDDAPVAVLREEGGRLAAVNAAAATLFGAGAVVGAPLASLFVEDQQDKLIRVLASPQPCVSEIDAVRPGRVPMTVRFLIVPLGREHLLVTSELKSGVHGEPIERALMQANSDMANAMRELSRHMAELKAARAYLERLGRLRDEFIAVLSHDIRSPLGSIKLQASAIRSGVGDPSRWATAIERTADRIVALLDRVLEMARLEQPNVELHTEHLRLPELAAEVVEMLDPVASTAGVRLVLQAQGSGVVDGDRVRLGQLLTNLVDNAIRHSPEGGMVRIEIEEQPARVRCAVCDQGPGVPREARATLFERFRQGRRPGAIGLGLYIARQVAELHGGRIYIEDATPQGACFVFELPRV